MRRHAGPPRASLWLLERFSGWGDDYGAAGDFEEYYRALAAERGAQAARRACRRQVAAAFPGHLKNVSIWSVTMLKNYLRVALRNLWAHKGYSAINIGGLALGLACALFILLWVRDELGFDRFHAGAASLYRVEQDQPTPRGDFHVYLTPYRFGPMLKSGIPEVREAIRVVGLDDLLVRRGEKAFFEPRVRAVDPAFLTDFSFPLVRGDAAALGRPGSLVVTESTARKYFGAEDPLGRTLTVNDAHELTVTAVARDVRPDSSLRFDALVPLDFTRTLGVYDDSLGNQVVTFVRLQPGADAAAAAGKITGMVKSLVADAARQLTDPEARRRLESRRTPTFSLLPLADIHLRARFGYSRANTGVQTVYAFALVGLLVLLVACINFMNLATARSAHRAREVGLRKVVGALRRTIVGQFYGESFLTAAFAAAVSLVLVSAALPGFNAISGKTLSPVTLLSGKFLLGLAAVTLFTGFLAGSYPALFLSSFRPARVLKGTFGGSARGGLFRKTLVLFQFGLSITLLIGMGVVSRQVDHMRSMRLGYDREHLIYLPLQGGTQKSYAALKERLLRDSRIQGVTATDQQPTQMSANGAGADWDGKDPSQRYMIGLNAVDFDYPETMKIELRAGRSFRREFTTDADGAFLVNEEVVKLMGIDPEAAVGKRFRYGVEGTIIGVMRNFHYQSVRNPVPPLAVVIVPDQFRFAVVRLRAGDTPAALEAVRAAWRDVLPRYPMEFRFFDEDFETMYRAESRMGALLRAFSALAIAIACLGLLGLAAYTAEQRSKEIGVRKVLGASSRGIVAMLSGEFGRWVLAANLLAWPAAYLLMRGWLRGFASRTPLSWTIFAASGVGALAVALAAVSFQAVRASRLDPVRTLKYE